MLAKREVRRPRSLSRRSAASDQFWSAAEFAIGPALFLLTTPILLGALGENGFGEYAFGLAAAGMVALLNPGLPVSAAQVVARLGSRQRQAQFGLVVLVVTVAIMSMAGALVSGVVHLLHPQFNALAAYSLPMILVGIALGCIQQIDLTVSGLLKGCLAFRRAALLELSGRVLCSSATIVAAIFGAGSTSVLSALTAGAVVVVATKVWAFFAIAGIGIARTGVARYFVRRLRQPAGWNWVQSLASGASMSVDRLLVGLLLSPASLGVYAICMQGGRLAYGSLYATFQRLLPVSSNLAAASDHQTLGREVIRAYRLTLAMILIGNLISLTAAQFLLSAWLGAQFAANHVTTFVAAVAVFSIGGLSVVGHHVLLGRGDARSVALVYLAAAILMLCAIPIGIEIAGLDGAVGARLVYFCVLLVLPWLLFLSLRRRSR